MTTNRPSVSDWGRLKLLRKRYPHRRPELIGVAPSTANTQGGRYWRWQTILHETPRMGSYLILARPNGKHAYAMLQLHPDRPVTAEQLVQLQNEADRNYDSWRIRVGLPL